MDANHHPELEVAEAGLFLFVNFCGHRGGDLEESTRQRDREAGKRERRTVPVRAIQVACRS